MVTKANADPGANVIGRILLSVAAKSSGILIHRQGEEWSVEVFLLDETRASAMRRTLTDALAQLAGEDIPKKVCGLCRDELAITSFSFDKGNSDGLCRRCKPCESHRLADYYAAQQRERA